MNQKSSMEFDKLEGTQTPKQEHSSISPDIKQVYDVFRELRSCHVDDRNEQQGRILSSLDDLCVTPDVIQGVIDTQTEKGDDLEDFACVDAFSRLLDYLVKITTVPGITLDFTNATVKTIYPFGCDYENKRIRFLGDVDLSRLGDNAHNCIFEADTMSGFGTDASNCTFRAKIMLGEDGGMERCKLYADQFYGPVGMLSSECEFYSKKPFSSIAKQQDGTSRFFVEGVEVPYEYYNDWNEVVLHEP